MPTAIHIDNIKVYKALESVSDPEIPVLTVLDLGVIRRVDVKGKMVEIDLTPTYTGCPAMDTIAADISTALEAIGLHTQIKMVLSPAWTTEKSTVGR